MYALLKMVEMRRITNDADKCEIIVFPLTCTLNCGTKHMQKVETTGGNILSLIRLRIKVCDEKNQ